MNWLVYRCRCIYLGYLYHCAPYCFCTGQIYRTNIYVSEVPLYLPDCTKWPRLQWCPKHITCCLCRRWRKLEKSMGKNKKNENASILQLISFQRKTGQKMNYVSFQQLFKHLTTNQIDFRSSKRTIQLKLTWKTEPFSAVRNAKPETQPGSQTCDVKMMLRIGIFAKAPKWQWFFSGVFGTCCRSK